MIATSSRQPRGVPVPEMCSKVVPSRRRDRRLWLSVVGVLVASAVLSALPFSGRTLVRTPDAAARARGVSLLSEQRRALQGPDWTGLGVPATGGRAATIAVPGGVPRAVARTMSLTTPIQGGLSARQEQALSTRLVSAHRAPPVLAPSQYWTPALGRNAVARAESWLGLPYSWAGGNAAGPTLGRCAPHTGGDLDCHVVGFDCSGLTM